MRRLALCSALAVLTACSDNTAPQPVELADSPGDPVSNVTTFGITPIAVPGMGVAARGLNDAGQVAGTFHDTFGPRAFVWENGTFAFTAEVGGRATDINAGGTIVGAIQEPNTQPNAAVWPAGATGIVLPLVAGPSYSEAVAINDEGMIAGVVVDEWFVWQDHSDRNPTFLTAPGIRIRRVNAMSNRGRLVGWIVAGNIDDSRPVFWPDPSTTARELKGFDGGTCIGIAADINEHDEIVGSCGPSLDDQAPAYWPNPDAVPIRLPGPTIGYAVSINELGQILGGDQVSPKLWMREGDAFRPYTIGTTGEGAAPIAINNRGQALGAAGFPETGYVWSIPVAARIAVATNGGKAIKVDGKGIVEVTIFGSRWLRTADIDPATLTLGNDDGLETSATRKKGQPVFRSTDADRDGFADLVVEFDERTLMNQHDLVAGQQFLYLLGRFRDGTNLRGAAPLQ